MKRHADQFEIEPEVFTSRSSLCPPKPPIRFATAASADDEPFLLDIEQASPLVAISKPQILRLMCLGQFPQQVRVGSIVRWRHCDIQQWVADGCPKLDNRRLQLAA